MIDLLNEKISILKATKGQNEIINKIEEITNFILLEKEGITNENAQIVLKKTDKNTKKRNFFRTKKSDIKNALKLYDKRTDINAFANGDILFGNLESDVYLPEDLESKPKFKESIAERVKMRSQTEFEEKNQEGKGLKV